MAIPRILDEAAVALGADGPTNVAVAHTSREPGYWRDRVAPAG